MPVIRHTPAEGTVVHGTLGGDGVWPIASMHGFVTGRRRGIFLPDTIDRWPRTDVIEALAAALRAAGHTVELDITYGYRPAAESETARAARLTARAARLSARADRISTTADGLIDAADAVFESIPLGQPGDFPARRRAHDRLDRGTQLRRDAATLARAARASAVNLEYRWDPRTTMRRIDELNSELRSWRRELDNLGDPDDAVNDTMRHTRCTAEVDRCTDAIAFWTAYLTRLEETGEFTAWTRDHFRPGDHVNVGGHWYPVVRANAKTLTVQGEYGNRTVGYSKLGGRRRTGWQTNTPDGGEITIGDGQALEDSRKLREQFALMGRFDARTADERRAIERALAEVLDAESGLAAATLIERYDDAAAAAATHAIDLAHAFVNAYRRHRGDNT